MRVIHHLSTALVVGHVCCTTLKILPLGDSITFGLFSTDGNGYREQLYSDLAPEYTVDYVGSVHYGTMLENANDGYIGFQISQIAAIAAPALFTQPDIVLLHAGSNDCIYDLLNQPFNQAPQRLSQLMAGILDLAPNTLLMVAQIIGTKNPIQQARIDTFNKQVPLLVNQYANTKYRVRTVDMTSITGSDTVDGVHPNEAAYHRMGDLWYAAIQSAAQEGLLDGSPIIATSTSSKVIVSTDSAPSTSSLVASVFANAASSSTTSGSPTPSLIISTISVLPTAAISSNSGILSSSGSSSRSSVATQSITTTTSRPTSTPAVGSDTSAPGTGSAPSVHGSGLLSTSFAICIAVVTALNVFT